MKKTIALLALAASSAAYAQLVSLPPVVGPTTDLYGNAALWDSQINSLTISTGGNDPINGLLAGDGVTGGGVAPGAPSDLTAVRIIYLGESAGWWNDFGVTLGAPTNSSGPGGTSSTANASAVTLSTDVPYNISPFKFWDLSLSAAQFANFDIWLNAAANTAGPNPTPTTDGGLYHAYHTAWDNPAEAYQKAYWSQAFALNTNYFDTSTSTVQQVAATTYILSFEDLRQGASDYDHSDLILAVQFIGKNDRPNSGVPEPTTYGVIGAAALLGLITIRRRLQK